MLYRHLVFRTLKCNKKKDENRVLFCFFFFVFCFLFCFVLFCFVFCDYITSLLYTISTYLKYPIKKDNQHILFRGIFSLSEQNVRVWVRATFYLTGVIFSKGQFLCNPIILLTICIVLFLNGTEEENQKLWIKKSSNNGQDSHCVF